MDADLIGGRNAKTARKVLGVDGRIDVVGENRGDGQADMREVAPRRRMGAIDGAVGMPDGATELAS